MNENIVPVEANLLRNLATIIVLSESHTDTQRLQAIVESDRIITADSEQMKKDVLDIICPGLTFVVHLFLAKKYRRNQTCLSLNST